MRMCLNKGVWCLYPCSKHSWLSATLASVNNLVWRCSLRWKKANCWRSRAWQWGSKLSASSSLGVWGGQCVSRRGNLGVFLQNLLASYSKWIPCERVRGKQLLPPQLISRSVLKVTLLLRYSLVFYQFWTYRMPLWDLTWVLWLILHCEINSY